MQLPKGSLNLFIFVYFVASNICLLQTDILPVNSYGVSCIFYNLSYIADDAKGGLLVSLSLCIVMFSEQEVLCHFLFCPECLCNKIPSLLEVLKV